MLISPWRPLNPFTLPRLRMAQLPRVHCVMAYRDRRVALSTGPWLDKPSVRNTTGCTSYNMGAAIPTEVISQGPRADARTSWIKNSASISPFSAWKTMLLTPPKVRPKLLRDRLPILHRGARTLQESWALLTGGQFKVLPRTISSPRHHPSHLCAGSTPSQDKSLPAWRAV